MRMNTSLLDLEYIFNTYLTLSTLIYMLQLLNILDVRSTLWSRYLQTGQEPGNMDEFPSIINYIFPSNDMEQIFDHK